MSVPKDHSIINAEEEKETEKRRLTSGGFSRSGLKSRFSEMCESLPETMDRRCARNVSAEKRQCIIIKNIYIWNRNTG